MSVPMRPPNQPAAPARALRPALAGAAGWLIRAALTCATGAWTVGPAAAQPPEFKVPERNLTLRPVGPPLPAFKYELLPKQDLVKNNAALLIYRAIVLMAEARPADKEAGEALQKLYDARQRPLDRFPQEEVGAYVSRFTHVYKELEAAAKCDYCEWGLDGRLSAEGIGVLLPDAQKMRELAMLLTLRARLYAAGGKVEPALKDIRTGVALARCAGEGPTLIHFLIGTAIATLMIEEVERVLQVPGCPNLYWSLTALPRPLIDLRKGIEGELRSMEATIPFPKGVEKGPMTPDEARIALDRMWTGMQKLGDVPGAGGSNLGLAESRLGLAAYVTLHYPSARRSLLDAGKSKEEVDAMPAAQVVMLDSLVRFRNLRDQHFVWFQAPYAEAMEGMRASMARFQELRGGPTADFLQTMLRLLLPAVDRMYLARLRTERRVASLRTVEAVRLYAAEHEGKLPATLADTPVPVPVDPATGKPFDYAVDGQRLTITVPPPPGERADLGNTWKYVVTLVPNPRP